MNTNLPATLIVETLVAERRLMRAEASAMEEKMFGWTDATGQWR